MEKALNKQRVEDGGASRSLSFIREKTSLASAQQFSSYSGPYILTVTLPQK